MKNKILAGILIVFLLIFTTCLLSCEEEKEYVDLSVMSFNIRLNTSVDKGVKSWGIRRPLVKDYVISKSADVVCFQEVTVSQKEHIKEDFADSYETYWKGRDNTSETEGLAILYKKDRFELVESGVFWLSETPEEMSKGWSALYYRICVNVTLRDKISDKVFTVYNVHLDHISGEARENGIKLVAERAKEKGNEAIICGDFNANESSECVSALALTHNSAKAVASISDEGGTYNDFGGIMIQLLADFYATPIDHIFVEKSIIVDEYVIFDERPNEDGYYSDHYAIMAKIRLEK